MIQADGIRMVTSFGPFSMVPEQAWRQARAAMIATAKLYGFDVVIAPANPEKDDEAFRAYMAWQRQAMKPDEQEK